VINATPWLFFPGKNPVPTIYEARWDAEPVWTGAENLAPTGIRSTDRPARSESLYRLRYPRSHMFVILVNQYGEEASTGKRISEEILTVLQEAFNRSRQKSVRRTSGEPHIPQGAVHRNILVTVQQFVCPDIAIRRLPCDTGSLSTDFIEEYRDPSRFSARPDRPCDPHNLL